MAELLAVRHGETTLNAAGLLTGQLDPELTARGRDQAAQLAPLLAGPFDVVVHSGTLRTAQTLRAAGVPEPWRVDRRFLERAFGTLEGEPAARWTQPPDVHAAPPGGESYAQLAARVAAALGDLEGAGRVLLCAHSGVLRVLRALAGEVDGVDAFLAGGTANGAVLSMTYDNAPIVPAFLAAASRRS